MKRNLYLNIQNRVEACQNFLDHFQHLQPQYEIIDTINSLNRITYEAIDAKLSVPSYNSCAMDGIAVISSHTILASENHPVVLHPQTDYVEVDTGDMIQDPYDAVIMAEDLIETDDGYKIIAPTHPFAHVRAIGEDIVTKEMVLPSHHKIRSIDIAVLLSTGNSQIKVIKKPTVAILPTGDEMVDYHEEIKDGRIMETNSWMFVNLIQEHGGEAVRYPILRDDLELIKRTLLKAVQESDLVIINAGSSAGRDDYTIHAISQLGKVFTHGVSIKPGKPVILGEVKGKPVIGLPGYPLSSYFTFDAFVVPLLKQMQQQKSNEENIITAKITKTLMSSFKYEEYVRVKLGKVNDEIIAAPLQRGAAATMSLVQADGFCVIPENSEGVNAHDLIKVHLLTDLNQIENTFVMIGSHDLLLDVINDQIKENSQNFYVSSTHVGSLSGLIALRKHESHCASTHLLDEKTGLYNTPIIKEMFTDEKMVLIKGVRRRQGLIVRKGNPDHIYTLKDCVHHRFINRQKGSGTRVLLDYQLKCQGISGEQIPGYDHEATTHMAVAVAVAKKNADVGMGIYSCAKALDLDFIDIAYEEYDFVTYENYLNLPFMKSFLEVLKSEKFHRKLDELGGYTYEEIGEIYHL